MFILSRWNSIYIGRKTERKKNPI